MKYCLETHYIYPDILIFVSIITTYLGYHIRIDMKLITESIIKYINVANFRYLTFEYK